MTGNPSKLAVVFALLLSVWVVTYWLWEPRVDPATAPISFATGPAGTGGGGAAEGSAGYVAAPLAGVAVAGQGGDRAANGTAELGASGASAGPGAMPAPAKVFVPPTFREYTVQAGDRGFDSIARRVYGDARLADAIASANPLVSPSKLVPGRTKLRIPDDPKNVQGKVVTVWPKLGPAPGAGASERAVEPVQPTATGKPAAAGAPGAAAGAAGATADVREHVVAERETLSHIAQRYYGKSAMWQYIYDSNRDRIENPDRVKPGTRLRIPAAR